MGNRLKDKEHLQAPRSYLSKADKIKQPKYVTNLN